MAAFHFIVYLLVGLVPYNTFAAPAQQERSNSWIFSSDHLSPPFNSTVAEVSGNLAKREVLNKCSNGFSSLLATALQDASDIMANMVAHLELAVALFDTTGELIPDKVDKADRSFDEQNAIFSFKAFIAQTYFGSGDAQNQAGYYKLVNTLNLAKAIKGQFANYISGTNVPWTRGGIPYVYILCTDEDLYSATNEEGLTYTEDTGGVNPVVLSSGKSAYWMSAKQFTEGAGNVWIQRLAVCGLGDGATTRFENPAVPVLSGLKAYTYNAIYGLIEETIVFCPAKQGEWEAYDASMIESGLPYRNMHIPIGGTPTTQQATDAASIAPNTIDWFKSNLVKTLIHESTHSVAFVTPDQSTLTDVQCSDDGQESNTTDPGCLYAVVKGTQGTDAGGNPQGHRDAEAFATYAMAVWINNVYWYNGYKAKVRT